MFTGLRERTGYILKVIRLRIHEFFNDSSALRERAFFIIWLISPEKNWSDVHENFIIDVPLDKKVRVKFWKWSRFRIRTSDLDRIRLCVGMRSPGALVSHYFQPQPTPRTVSMWYWHYAIFHFWKLGHGEENTGRLCYNGTCLRPLHLATPGHVVIALFIRPNCI